MARPDPRRQHLQGRSTPRASPAERIAKLAERGDALDTMLAWERFLVGGAVARPVCHYVVSSWRRSLAAGVNPRSQTAPLAARGDAMAALRQRHRRLLDAAAPILAEAAELFDGSRSIMLLTDPDGVVLEAVGDRVTLEAGEAIHLIPGGAWAEGLIGTNGIGTALATGRPAQVHAAEHFAEGIKRWTCAAAPIFAPLSRDIVGLVDISGPPATYQRSHLALAVATARQIETALAERAARARTRLLEACLQRLSSADAAGLVALDRGGRLVHAAGGIAVPVALGERLPGLSEGVPVEDWADRLPEGWRPEWLNPVADRGEAIGALLVIPSRKRTPAPPARGGGFAAIVHRSPAITALLARARLLAGRRVAVLIEGETGTGKELLARALHGGEGPFIAYSCGAASRELLAGELFGHVRGAFTGATTEGRPGRFELAHQGTLCLDEIGELPLDLQPMLLRVLEEGAVYRLGVTTLTLPPLRDRAGDVELLAGHFLHLLAARHGLACTAFTPAAMAALAAHDWPGNVRELRNAIESALLVANGPAIDAADLPAELHIAPRPAAEADDSLQSAEQAAIARALAASPGNLAEAARHLGISRSTLYRKLDRYGLKP